MIGPQRNKDVVRVYVGRAHLRQRRLSRRRRVIGRPRRSRSRICGRSRRSGSGSSRSADRRLTTAHKSGLNPAIHAASRGGIARVAALGAHHNPVSADSPANSLGIGRESSSGAGDALSRRATGPAGSHTGRASDIAVEVLSVGAADLPEDQSLANPEMVHVESVGAGAAVDGSVENSIQRTSGTCALEGELVLAAGEDAHAAGVASMARGADTPPA